MICQTWELFPGQKRRVLLSLSRDIPHEDVCPDQSDFHQTSFCTSLSEDFGSPLPASSLHFFHRLLGRHLFPTAGKKQNAQLQMIIFEHFLISRTQGREQKVLGKGGLSGVNADHNDLSQDHINSCFIWSYLGWQLLSVLLFLKLLVFSKHCAWADSQIQYKCISI